MLGGFMVTARRERRGATRRAACTCGLCIKLGTAGRGRELSVGKGEWGEVACAERLAAAGSRVGCKRRVVHTKATGVTRS